MNNFSLKIRQVFLPYLLIVNGVLICFFAIDWQLNKQSASAQGAVWNFLVPGAVTAVLIGLFLRPRLFILEENESRNSSEKDQGYVSFYLWTMTLVLCMTWSIDKYVSKRIGGVAVLNNIAEIDAKPPARFYFLKQAYTNRNFAAYDSLVVQPKGGKPRSYLRIVIPLLNNDADTLKDVYAGWLAFELSREFSSRTDSEAWDSTVAILNHAMRAGFKAARLDSLLKFHYLERSGSSDKDQFYIRAVQNSQVLPYLNPPVILYPVYRPFEQRNSGDLLLMLCVYIGGVALFLFNLIITKLKV